MCEEMREGQDPHAVETRLVVGEGTVIVGMTEGFKHDSAVNLDHIQTVERAWLSRYVGRLANEKMRAVCRAIAAATG